MVLPHRTGSVFQLPFCDNAPRKLMAADLLGFRQSEHDACARAAELLRPFGVTADDLKLIQQAMPFRKRNGDHSHSNSVMNA